MPKFALEQLSADTPHLACGAVGDVSAIPKTIDTDVLELGGWCVGVQSLP